MVQGALMMRVALALVVAVLCGCTTFSKPKIEKPGYLQVLQAKGVDAGTYARVASGRVLGYRDIKNLVEKGVPGRMIVPYLKATRVPYKFTPKAINGLVKAGADDAGQLLGKAAGIYMEDEGDMPSSQGGGRWRHPYFNDIGYMGLAPFEFAYPGEWYGDYDDWAD